MRLQPFANQRPLIATSPAVTVPQSIAQTPPWEGPSQFPPALPPTPVSLTLATVITPDKLKWHFDDAKWRKGDAPGADGVRLSQLSESEAWDICRDLNADIQRGSWQPRAPREFRREKHDGTFRTIEIRDAFTRVVSATVAADIWPIIKRIVPRSVASVHGGVHQVLLLIQCLAAERGCFAIASDDIRQAFDHVPVADSVRDFARYITDPRLLDLTEKILVGHRIHQPSPIGIAQGDSLSSPAMELRLHYVLDLPDQSDRRVSPLQIRYVDNVYRIGCSVSSVTEALAEDERQLNRAGFNLKHADGPPRDIREVPLDLLGFRITATQHNQVQFFLLQDAYESLRHTLEEAHHKANPRNSARSKIQGWITSNGPVWGNAEKSQAISHIRWMASQSGFTGLLTKQEIRHWIGQAADSWTQKSQGATLSRLLGESWGG